MAEELKFQIGKNGITEGVIEFLDNAIKVHKTIRISVFKSSGRDRESIKEMAKELETKIAYPSVTKIIGFTIILRRKSVNKKDK
jgi:RNA-binding protein YhbY